MIIFKSVRDFKKGFAPWYFHDIPNFISLQGTLIHAPTGNCIDRGSQSNGDKPIMTVCDGRESQVWTFGFYNSTVFPAK